MHEEKKRENCLPRTHPWSLLHEFGCLNPAPCEGKKDSDEKTEPVKKGKKLPEPETELLDF